MKYFTGNGNDVYIVSETSDDGLTYLRALNSTKTIKVEKNQLGKLNTSITTAISKLIQKTKKDFEYLFVDLSGNIAVSKVRPNTLAINISSFNTNEEKAKYINDNIRPIVIHGDGSIYNVEFIQGNKELKQLILNIGLHFVNNPAIIEYVFENAELLSKHLKSFYI